VIKINLATKGGSSGAAVDVVEASFDLGSSEIQKQGLIKLFIILLGPLGLLVWQNQNLPAKQMAVNQKQKILNELTRKNESAKSAVEEIKKYKADEARLREQIKTIEGLRADRMREVRILDLIQREIPERMWLAKIEMKENKMNISGFAAADAELTQFMDTLSGSTFLQEVNLVKIAEKSIDSTFIKEFTISAAVRKKENRPTGGSQ